MLGSHGNTPTLQALTGCILAVILFISLNIWVDRTFPAARLDLTADGLYTITDSTRSVLKSIREPIRIRFYASENLDGLGPDYIALRKRAGELLQEYARMSGGLVRIEHLDPTAFSPEEDLAVADGIQAIPDVIEGTQIFLGLAGTNSTDGRYVMAHLAPERAKFLEHDLTRMIHDLATPRKAVVAVLGDLPMQGDRASGSAPWAVLDEVERFFEIRQMFDTVERFDDDIGVIWLTEPGTLDETTVYALDQFVMRGGRILAFVDPYSESLALAQQHGNLPQPRKASVATLAPLLEAWGVTIPERKVVGDRRGALQVQMQKDGRVIVTDYLAWFAATETAFPPDDLVTGNLKLIQFRTAGHIETRDDAGTHVEPIIKSSDQASEIDVAAIEYAPDPTRILAEFVPAGRRFVLAARITGPVESAWPDGPGEEIGNTEIRAAHKSKADAPLSLILVADSDMLRDDSWVESQNFFGQNLAVPYANNGDFVVNALEQLTGSSAMMGLRGRGIADRRFEVLEEMAQLAERQYRTKEQALRDNIAALQTKIVQMQESETDQSVILTTEQQSEIDRSRGEMLDLRRELRDVQFALRKDVSDLKTRIIALNIWAVPALIGLFALLMAIWRLICARRYREAGS